MNQLNHTSLFVISILIFCCCFPRVRTQNYTTPQLVDSNCTSATFSSLVFPSTAPPWAFNWRINNGNDDVLLVAVTVPADPTNPLLVTPGPTSEFSDRYSISNSPDLINDTSTPFRSSLTIFNVTENENFTLSVPGLESEPFSKYQCPLPAVNELINSISCSTTPCTCESTITLSCNYGDPVLTTCPFNGAIVNTCPEGGLSPGAIAGICIGVIVGIGGLGALVYFCLWPIFCKKRETNAKDEPTDEANDTTNKT